MTAKEFLRQYQDCEQRIRSRKRRIQPLKEQADGLTQSFMERVQSRESGDRQARIIETYLDMEKELEAEVLRFRETQRQVSCAIDALENSRQRDVLERYYIEGMTFEGVADDMWYSHKQICRIHGKALEKIKEGLNVLCQV